MRLLRLLQFLPPLFSTALPQSLHACSVCFGDPDSELTQGLHMGVLALLAVVMVVLGGVTAFFIYLAKRSSRNAGVLPLEDSAPQALK